MNTNVNFEIANLLKENGYNKRSEPSRYNNYGELTMLEGINAPTIAEVVMWLYEKYEVWISVVPYNDEELSQTLWENKIIDIKDDYNDCSDYTFYHSLTEAYEAAIIYVLKINLVD